MTLLFSLLIAVFSAGCQKIEDLFSDKKSSSVDSEIVSSAKSSLIATRKDASVEIESKLF